MNPESSEHVEDETFLRMACNELTAAETAAVQAHLELCQDCGRVWQAVSKVREAAVEFDPGAVPPVDSRFGGREKPRRWWLGSAAAAALVVMAVVVPRLLGPPDSPKPSTHTPQVVRSGQERGPRLFSPVENSQVSKVRFEWSFLDDASGYTVELLDEDGAAIWTSRRLQENLVDWPPSLAREPGNYYWRVSAHFPDGEETISSPLTLFTLLPE
ncbi:MAG: zf-HC2 domain-containing protein [Deltaproteobacteria bacterium]|nr:zf-HC2 domain-containing protein [Deltaproteobacteria bacterium]